MNARVTQQQALALADALQIFTKNERLVDWLAQVDPMALAQARRALEGIGINPHAEGWARVDTSTDDTRRGSRFVGPRVPMGTTVADIVGMFPATFGLRGFAGRTFRINPTACYMEAGRPAQLVVEVLQNASEGVGPRWVSFGKGTAVELDREVVTLPHDDDAMFTCPGCGESMLTWQRDAHACKAVR